MAAHSENSKSTKVTTAQYGVRRFRLMVDCTRRGVRMGLSSCGNMVREAMGCGGGSEVQTVMRFMDWVVPNQ